MNSRSLQLMTLTGALLVAGLAEATGGAQPVADSAASLERDRAYFTDTPLVTQHGTTVRFFTDVLQDQVVVINTIYTHCPGACPLMIEKLKEVRAALKPSTRARVMFVSISVDPERDTPARLRQFAQRLDLPPSNWLLLTGEKANIDRVVTQLGQQIEDFREHSSLVLAGNVPARHWAKIAPYLSPVAIAARLEQVLGK